MLKYSINLNNKSISNSLRQMPFWLAHKNQSRTLHHEQKITKNLKSFQNKVKNQQMQAKRSIFIESPDDPNSVQELTAYCTKFGKIRNIFRSEVETKSYFLVEFQASNVPNEIIRSAHHFGSYLVDGKIRVRGRFLSFTPKNDLQMKHMQQNIMQERNLLSHGSILNAMRKEKSIDDQIMVLYNTNKLSDLSSRLRFLTALQIEEAISGIFHEAQVLPFGSSINGFGRMQSDLDMVLMSFGNRTSKSLFDSISLGKPSDVTRQTIRNNLFVLSSIAKHWLQGVDEVTPVLNARVPIIKYVQRLTQLDCDLSMGNYSGYQMSEMLYTFGEIDERVRPLVFFVRAWAKEFDIIQTFPALGLSNFMITCLVIFFLQQLQKPILPPAESFLTFPEVNENVQYITDTSKLNFKSENTNTLAELVAEFFDYYSSFDFNKDAPSITYGLKKRNIGNDSMYIYNPLDHGLNVSRNVTDFERNQFVEKCKISRDTLTNGRVDAVELLEFYNRVIKREKIDRLINNSKKSSERSNNNPAKFNVKTLMNVD